MREGNRGGGVFGKDKVVRFMLDKVKVVRGEAAKDKDALKVGRIRWARSR